MADTATLPFQSAAAARYTIDFIAHHPVNEPVASPGVVDIVVTQHPVEDDTPEMTLRVDGEAVPVVTRLHRRRSVVATLPLAEFDRIATRRISSSIGAPVRHGGSVRVRCGCCARRPIAGSGASARPRRDSLRQFRPNRGRP